MGPDAGVSPAHVQTPLILALDVGTSSVRAVLYDGRARPVEGTMAQQAHQMYETVDGGVETGANQLLARVEACIDGALEQAGPLAERIAAVASDTFWHNVLGVSAGAAAVTPVYTWADTRAAAAAEALKADLDQAEMHARTGAVLHPSYLPAKLRWLQDAGPRAPLSRSTRSRVRRWLSFADWLGLRFFGECATSVSMASGSGLLNQLTCDWDAAVLKAIPLDRTQLPDLRDEPYRGLRPAYARRWPHLAQIPWFPAWGDGATSNIGAGCVTSSQVAMMVGTSGAMRVVRASRDLVIPPYLFCYRVDSRRAVIGGALSNGGNLIDWLRATLQVPENHEAMERAVADLEPDGHGLTILPFLAGERSPGWKPRARAVIAGLGLHNTPSEIVRAGYETVANRFALIHALLKETNPRIGPVVASGAALLHSPTWLQIMADALGAAVTASAVPEASSRGAALLALEALGAIRSVSAIPAPEGTVYRPRAANTTRYRAAAARQHALYQKLVASEDRPDVPGWDEQASRA
ncbi:MAG TPA: FGGY family carbohydrate kinase [Chloroflexota bacterium]|nr:FGGY family carbohydrate kinase [Chloroflexota bacterium]